MTLCTPSEFLAWVTPKTRVTDSGCFEWEGGTFASGYGRLWAGKKNWRLHRLAYVLLKGPIPEGLELNHLCRNRRCWNPEHLEAVTHAENMRRSAGLDLWAKYRKDRCIRGHDMNDSANHYYRRDNGYRMCRACHLYRAKRKQYASV